MLSSDPWTLPACRLAWTILKTHQDHGDGQFMIGRPIEKKRQRERNDVKDNG